MSEATETSEDPKHDLPKKRLRHRKKLLYANIRKQMEFYFSDANISKDRFLGELTKVQPFVPVDTFLKFNKIRALTQDVQDVVKAIKHSEVLELSEDKTNVHRRIPFEPYDADSRTVYVELLPVTANQDWLERVFGDYGQVAYISLPKFKNSNRIKGYAFIEYNKPEEAQNCINAFTKMGCKLPTNMVPDELSSIKMFAVEEPLEKKIASKEENNADTFNNEETDEPPKKKKKKDRKKSLELKSDGDLDSDAEKKEHTSVDESQMVDTELIEVSHENESKEETSQDESNTEENKKKKKNRKRSKEHKKKCGSQDALWGLQILSKNEWKRLRNKYLNEQRKNMAELKKQWRNNRHSYKDIPAPSLEVKPDISKGDTEKLKRGTKPVLKRLPGLFVKTQLPEPCLDIRDTKRKVNIVLNTKNHIIMTSKSSGAAALLAQNIKIDKYKNHFPSYEFLAFLLETFGPWSLDAKKFGQTIGKLLIDASGDQRARSFFFQRISREVQRGNAFRTNIHVQHVDVKDGQTEVILRFDTAEAATQYCTITDLQASVLSGGQEDEQWNLVGGVRPRGRERLLLRAGEGESRPADPQPTTTHIRFDDV